ncbi:MAG TPA: hypothetical protein VFG69_16185, partial [Nannocystaceae bacterium]|nr:hypothetical protein [Nannocystaceae bacterium]
MTDEIPTHDADLVAELDDLGVWSPDDPPAGFVDDVLARAAHGSATELPAAPPREDAVADEPTTRRRLPRAVAMLGAAAAIAAAVVLSTPGATHPTKGSIEA